MTTDANMLQRTAELQRLLCDARLKSIQVFIAVMAEMAAWATPEELELADFDEHRRRVLDLETCQQQIRSIRRELVKIRGGGQPPVAGHR